MSWQNLPLHPMVVHFPIVLGVVLMIMSLFYITQSRMEPWSQRVWFQLIAISFLFLIFSMISTELGEIDEEIVESVFRGRSLHDHEEIGERIPFIAALLLITSTIGWKFSKNRWIPKAFVMFSLVGTGLLFQAGHSGAQLVYRDGAAQAFFKNSQSKSQPQKLNQEENEEDDD